MPKTPVPPGWKPLKGGGFTDLIGPVLLARDADGAKVCGLQVDETHQNAIGLIHGGVLTSLLDQILAMTAWHAADRQPVVTVQMDTRFLGSARAGDFLEARATLRHATRSMVFVDADIRSGTRAIAAASAVMKITRPVKE